MTVKRWPTLCLPWLMVIGWYAVVYIAARPLTSAPVADSWVYEGAVNHFLGTGRFHFADYSQVTPWLQVVLGSIWSRVFSGQAPSLDIFTVIFGAAGGILFNYLALNCGASSLGAALGTAILVANPCYLFLSFSFMTDVPFVALSIASFWIFSHASKTDGAMFSLAAALVSVLAFAMRPFGVAIPAAFALATLAEGRDWSIARLRGPAVASFAGAIVICIAIWIWFNVLHKPPATILLTESHLAWLASLSPAFYLRAGILNPILYFGLVTAPAAFFLRTQFGMRPWIILAVMIAAAATLLAPSAPRLPVPAELSCCGMAPHALLLRGPSRFEWSGNYQWIAVDLSAIGAAALILTARETRFGKPALAVLIFTGIYWLGIVVLWFFNDRYQLPMLIVACLIFALHPPNKGVAAILAGAGIAALGLISLVGVREYHRKADAVVAELKWLEQNGARRDQIDAGYALNGRDLYFKPDGMESANSSHVPMITSQEILDYVIAEQPLPGTTIIKEIRVDYAPGLSSEIFVLKRTSETARAPRAKLLPVAGPASRR